MTYNIKMPPSVYAGKGCIEAVKTIVEKEKVKRILVFTDSGVLKAGLAEKALDILECENVQYVIIDDLKPEPSYQEVHQAVKKAETFPCDMVLAIGGGSVIDAAKLCSVLKGADYSIKDLLDNSQKAKKQLKVTAVPTTCGTGAEATCNAIVAVPEEQVKKGIVNDAMIPDYVILDSDMINSIPKQIIASSGVDALAHVVECFTSNKATPLSDLYAAEGARLIFHNICEAYSEEGPGKAKENMMLGAFYGGVAITGSGTTAVHALSYPLGGKYHIPHGISNAILFPHVMRANKECCEKELARLCDAVWPEHADKSREEKAEEVIKAIEQIVSYTGIPSDLSPYGVEKEDLDFLVQAGSGQKRLLDNNRKKLTEEEIREIYRKVIQ